MRILLIEDEQKIIDFLKPSLESECFVVDVAKDGEKGSVLARINEYDIIILDNVLPKKEGKQICEEIREKDKTTPIIMLSVVSNTEKKVELLNSGADDYLTKPFSFLELMARIRALLRRPEQIREELLEIDNLVLDSRKQKVKRDKEEVCLTKKEFMLLEYLMKNQGIVLSRGMIMEHVWDMNADPFSNTIESHIASLRKKVDSTKKRKLIHTVMGRGYKVDVK